MGKLIPMRKASDSRGRDAFEQWLKTGIESGWVSDVVCSTHEGLPLRFEEEAAWMDGEDWCIPGMRVWFEG